MRQRLECFALGTPAHAVPAGIDIANIKSDDGMYH